MATLMLLATGCMKIDNKTPDHINYNGWFFQNISTKFITDDGGERRIKLTSGSREAYENQDYDNASFIELTLNLGYPEHGEWEGEYNWGSSLMGSIGQFEYGEKWRNETTWEINTQEFSVPVFSGTATIEHIEGNKYKVSFSGYVMTEDSNTLAISAKIENNVLMVVPQGDE